MRFRRNRFVFYHQLESTDCGPACLAMITSYYGRHFGLKAIKQMCAITRMGVSVQDLVAGAQKMNFDAVALKLALSQLEELPLPCILFWKQDHFIVLRKVQRKGAKVSYFLADPGYGNIVLDEEIFVNEWMGSNDKGVAVVVQPSANAPEQEKQQMRQRVQSGALAGLIKGFLKAHTLKYLLTGLLLLAGLVINWTMPIIFRKIIDEGIMNRSFQIVWVLLIAQFGLFLGNFVADSVSHWVLTKINFRLSISLKQNLLHKLMKLPVSYFDTRLNTDTLQRLGDQSKIQNFITWKGPELVLSVLNIVVFSLLLFFLNRIVFVVFLVLTIVSLIWVSFFLRLRSILEYSLFLRQSENNNSLYEFIMHMPEIKVNNAQHKTINKILAIQEKLNKIELRSLFLNMYQLIGVGFLSRLKEIIAIAMSAYLIIHGSMTLGALMSITYILGQLTVPVQNLVNYLRDAQDANIAMNRVSDVYQESDENTGKASPLPSVVHQLNLKNVQFKYPGSFNQFVLHDVSFNIPLNKVTAIIGQSGSGKTTLLKLLLSYYPVTGGAIYLNDVNLSEADPARWREQCGIVLQDGHIFSGTIAENICFADSNIDMERLNYAARTACIDNFIESLPMGYGTKVGNIGIQLSGGQKQRLLIARAVYKNPQFLFLDEATSSLDANNEKAIMENLKTFFANRTVLVIAHRLSTVKNADQIIVLENGVVAEVGNHESLTSRKGKYFELVKNQLELGS